MIGSVEAPALVNCAPKGLLQEHHILHAVAGWGRADALAPTAANLFLA